jgi:mannose-6-phosphate isomerase-like protein (cupin superfamily)
MEVLHVTGTDGVWQQLGPYEIETLISREQESLLTAYRVRIAPQSRTSTSYHLKAEELYYVISGSGRAMLNGQPFELKQGDFLRLPPGTRHSFETGEEELVMLDVHSPGSRTNRDVYFEGAAPEGFKVQADAD